MLVQKALQAGEVDPRPQDPNGWSAFVWLTGLEKTPPKAER